MIILIRNIGVTDILVIKGIRIVIGSPKDRYETK